MPEMVASYSSQRFSALLDFQRDVDLVYPSHIGKKNAQEGGFLLAPGNQQQAKAANHHRARHGDNTSWQQNWSESLSALLFQRPASVAESPRSCAVEARGATTKALARSQGGQFSAQKFIRNALKRAFARDEPVVVNVVKRARLFEDFASTAEPMVCG